MQARDVMTSHVISIDPESTVLQAARLMLQHRISGLPVVDAGGKLVGIISEGDFLRRQETRTERRRSRWLEFLMGPGRMADEYTHSHGNKVSAVMSVEVQTVEEDTALEDVVKMMERARIKRVPVMRGGKLSGIITRANLMRAMVSLSRAAPPVAKNDAALRERIVSELRKQAWAPVSMLDVRVLDGDVELWGSILDERQRGALKVAVENIPGVKSVKDHLAWVEPVSGMVVGSQ